MEGIYTLLISALKLAVQGGNKKISQELQSTLIKNFKGTEVKLQVRAIMKGTSVNVGTPATNTSGQKMKAATLSLADFEKKTDTPTLKAAVAKEGVKTFNPYKALIEMTDEELQAKMGDSTDSATQFINNIRAVTGETDLEDPKEFNEDFMTLFRKTLSTRISMTDEEVKAAEDTIKAEKAEAFKKAAEGGDDGEEDEALADLKKDAEDKREIANKSAEKAVKLEKEAEQALEEAENAAAGFKTKLKKASTEASKAAKEAAEEAEQAEATAKQAEELYNDSL